MTNTLTAVVADRDAYLFRLVFMDEQKTQIHEHPLAVTDFDRAIRETMFEGFRAGHFAAYVAAPEKVRIEPRFSAGGSPVRTEGFSVRVPRAGQNDFSCDFANAYFSARASTVRATLYCHGKVPKETTLYYALEAYLDDHSPAPLEGNPLSPDPFSLDQFSLDPATVCVPVRSLSCDAMGSTEAWDEPATADLPVFVSRTLLEDGCEEARGHPDREIGGLLLGHVCRDPRSSLVYLLVTCLVSAAGTTESSETSVTFTADSFARAREMIRLRAGREAPPEIVVGWLHSHPFRFCDQCPLPAPPECIQKILFFSSDDVQLMESTFDQPFMVGLLTAVEPKLESALGHLPVRLYGWRQGEIQARGFAVTDV